MLSIDNPYDIYIYIYIYNFYQHVRKLRKRARARARASERERERERERDTHTHTHTHTHMKNARNLQQLLTLAPEESRHNVPLMYVLTRGGVDLFQVRLN
jgi:ABC-type nickel/cobalt efflux system permease component RcnA